MTDRSGASPEGGAPDRLPQGEPEESAGVESERRRAARADHARDQHLPAPDLQAAASAPPWAPAPQPDAPTEREYEVPFDTGQLHALPTGQLLTVRRPPVEPVDEIEEEEVQRRVYSYVAAVIGVIGAAASLFVGWMLPLCIAAIVFGVLGLRREEERVPAFVGIGAGITGLVFSAVWIGYYAIVFGALPR